MFICAYWVVFGRCWISRYRAEQDALRERGAVRRNLPETTDVAPLFLRRLLGDAIVSNGEHVCDIHIDVHRPQAHAGELSGAGEGVFTSPDNRTSGIGAFDEFPDELLAANRV